MVRNLDEKLAYREEIRKQFFEDSNYRRWSDVTDINDSEYGGWRDDCLFSCYLLDTRTAIYDLNQIEKIFQQGDGAPVNWKNFYDYFNTQLNDKNNRYKREINYFKFYPGGIGASNNTKGMTVMQILDKYRDQLLHNNYDII